MCDTFRPLRLTTLARELDDPGYALSWAAAPARGVSQGAWAVAAGGGLLYRDAGVRVVAAAGAASVPAPVAGAPSLNPLLALGPSAWEAARGGAARAATRRHADAVALGCPVAPARLRRLLRLRGARDELRAPVAPRGRPAVPELAPRAGRLPRPVLRGRRSGTPVRAPARPDRRPAPSGRAPRSTSSPRSAGSAARTAPREPLTLDDAERTSSATPAERLERARHPAVGVRAARPVPRQVVPHLGLRLDRPSLAPCAEPPRPRTRSPRRSTWAARRRARLGRPSSSTASRSPRRSPQLYWTPAQMTAHALVNGAALTAGDVFARHGLGRGRGPPGLPARAVEAERWLADGDEVVIRGDGLGEVGGRVEAAAGWSRSGSPRDQP